MRLMMKPSEFGSFMNGFGALLLVLGFGLCAMAAISAFVPVMSLHGAVRDDIFKGLMLIAAGGGLRILTRIDRRLGQ